MSDTPDSLTAFYHRFNAGQYYSGSGLETTVHMPCPFCAAPECWVYPILGSREALERGATCDACGRSVRAVFTDIGPGSFSFEIVQTGGPDQPDWLEPKMRRLEAP